ncbi:hypothetical protein F2Q68_00011529 [Brassica cretica]|uniref:Uncharacterized protein n=1 Tax=Brassica cretica TaxID=69181 RepID=A0A8S9KWS0_BRACR|nr:hypothetical protein F2Q68_00011529 [Brassica cretica]
MTSRSNLTTVPLHLPTKPINHLSGTSTVVITKREDEIPSGGDEAELMDVTPIGVCLDCKLVYNLYPNDIYASTRGGTKNLEKSIRRVVTVCYEVRARSRSRLAAEDELSDRGRHHDSSRERDVDKEGSMRDRDSEGSKRMDRDRDRRTEREREKRRDTEADST